MTGHPLFDIPAAFRTGRPRGITSVCSAHPIVIEAALRLARDVGRPALIEATCNQVNQDGGYTGMSPADFHTFVEDIAKASGCGEVEIILGGDHLGPNPWKTLPADAAMAKAEELIAAYAEAGFTKLHLDTSMGCAGEPTALSDDETARRAARLASVAERHAARGAQPVYVIGTEVPVPGGAVEDLGHLRITSPAAVATTHDVHRAAFAALGLEDAFGRVIALVVQPGVEFGHSDVVHFDPEGARDLSASLRQLPGMVFEAHSTDFQTETALAGLVANGFAILKVGPWLTFALREALYGLDSLADVLEGRPPTGRLMATMEQAMRDAPGHWQKYYGGGERQQWLDRHFSMSDRIRYYWPAPAATAAVDALLMRLGETAIPSTLASQYLPFAEAGDADRTAREALLVAVQTVLRRYERAAAGPMPGPG